MEDYGRQRSWRIWHIERERVLEDVKKTEFKFSFEARISMENRGQSFCKQNLPHKTSNPLLQ